MRTNVEHLNRTISSLQDKALKWQHQEHSWVVLSDGLRSCNVQVQVTPTSKGTRTTFRAHGCRRTRKQVFQIAADYDIAATPTTEPLTWGEWKTYSYEAPILMTKRELSLVDHSRLQLISNRIAHEVMRETMDAVLDKWAHHNYRPTLSDDDQLQHLMADLYDYCAKRRGLQVEAFRIWKK
jgi:hypothetical protein